MGYAISLRDELKKISYGRAIMPYASSKFRLPGGPAAVFLGIEKYG